MHVADLLDPEPREHKLSNPGDVPMKLLCSCAPASTHDDTVLTEG